MTDPTVNVRELIRALEDAARKLNDAASSLKGDLADGDVRDVTWKRWVPMKVHPACEVASWALRVCNDMPLKEGEPTGWGPWTPDEGKGTRR